MQREMDLPAKFEACVVSGWNPNRGETRPAEQALCTPQKENRLVVLNCNLLRRLYKSTS